MDVLQIQSTLSFQENKFWIFSPASRPPISKPMLLPKGEYPEKYKTHNFPWSSVGKFWLKCLPRIGRGDPRYNSARKSNLPLHVRPILASSSGVVSISNLIFFPFTIHFRSIAVDEYANPGYPRRTRDWWWKCRNSQNMRELRNRNGLEDGLRNRHSRVVLGELRARSDSKTAFLPFHLILLSALVTISSSCKWRSFCELLTSSNPRVLKSNCKSPSNPPPLPSGKFPHPFQIARFEGWRIRCCVRCDKHVRI